MNKFLVLDYETRSEADLRRVGSFEYSMHPSTEILCAAWRIGTREELPTAPVKSWGPMVPGCAKNFPELLRALRDPGITIVAHNAFFEQVITRNVFSRLMPSKPELKAIPHIRWVCTATLAAAHALPRKLDGACSALKLSSQKDMEGHRLMLKWSKPRRATKHNDAKWHSEPSELTRLVDYCEADIDAETELFLALPPLHPREREIWLLDQEINIRGFHVDRELVEKILAMVAIEIKNLNKETQRLTHGSLKSTNQVSAMLNWLMEEGVFLPDLCAKTVVDFLAEGAVKGKAKRLLEIRQSVSKTSTKKYQAFEMRSRTDSRVRDILVYHSASTGRWGGSGVQPHNFPRGTLSDTKTAAEICKHGDLELVRALYGNPMEVFSSCLRSVIVAPEGRELFCADYAAIEARVLFWLADHQVGLESFFNNEDLYKEMASDIYSKPMSKIEKPERQLGKQAILGCGFGMGPPKFLLTCKAYSIEVDEEMAARAVKAYRNKHYPVVDLWGKYERIAIKAVQNPGKFYRTNGTVWGVKGKFLYCKLPSGRKLAYAYPEIQYDQTPWGEKRAVLYHWGVDPKTKKWVRAGTYGGRLTENVVQAVARDLMADAMLETRRADFDIVLSVHDELVAERDLDESEVEEFEILMAKVPLWAKGCPVKVEGWKDERYRK